MFIRIHLYILTEMSKETRIGELLLRLSELRRCNMEHIGIAMNSQKEHPDVDFGKLWQEIFFSRKDGPAFPWA